MLRIDQLSGSQFGYDYDRLTAIFDDATMRAYTEQTRRLFSPIAKAFDDTANTEWLLRTYLALKFILHATIMAGSARYCRSRNVQIAVPYLNYYLLLSTCRAFLLTCPDVTWQGVSTTVITHSKAINQTADLLKRLDADIAVGLKQRLLAAKDQRELFSYAFPMTGAGALETQVPDVEEAIRWAGVLAELAHLNSACLEGAVAKHSQGGFSLLEAQAWELMEHRLSDGEEYFDEVDWEWLSKLYSRHRGPVALTALVTEGMTEDFFGIWADGDAAPGGFDPDKQWKLLLDVW